MKPKHFYTFFFILIVFGGLFACSPSAVTSGTYHGTFTGDSLPDSTGNGTLTIIAQGELVDIKFESPGNPTIIQNGVQVVDEKPYGGNNYDFHFDDGIDYLSGVYHPDETKFITITCNKGQYTYNFTGNK